MSIIQRTNPLNLEYRIALVTSASSPLGVIICKILLKANAFVLGIDTKVRDETLNAGLGTHFQFEQCDLKDSGAPEKVVEAAQRKFGFERIDVLVNVGGGEGERKLGERVVEVMKGEGRGVVVNVCGDVEGKEGKDEVIDLTKALTSQTAKTSIRCNAIVAGDTGDAKTFENAKSHMKEIMSAEKKPSPNASTVDPRLYDIGNVTLFLASDISEGVSGSIVGLGGSYKPL